MIKTEGCPDNLKHAIHGYVVDGIPTGSFLRSVLENDLVNSAMRADEDNVRLLGDIAGFVFESVPVTMRGSAGKVNAHLLKMAKRRDRERDSRKRSAATTPPLPGGAK